jgi:biopolymer transport protein TolR
MAAGIQPVGRGGRRGTRRRPLAEINVTPFVDVMLVLLIIFMVTAPLLTAGVPVDLPKNQAKPMTEDREPLSITIRKDGSIYLQNNQVSMDTLVIRLTGIAANGLDERVYVRGDASVDYGRVMEVMTTLQTAGFTHIGLVTGEPKRKPDEHGK